MPPFKRVNVKLLSKDVHHVLRTILSTCHLSTDHLDDLLRSRPTRAKQERSSSASVKYHDSMWNEDQKTEEDKPEEDEQQIKKEPHIDFRYWLNQNVDEALQRLWAYGPLREETEQLRSQLKQILHLKDIVWNIEWGMRYFKSYLQCFQELACQYPAWMIPLKGRCLVFDHQTGVSFEGHVILSCEDVTTYNWLYIIQSVNQYEKLLQQIPKAEHSLSKVLRGIKVDHQKFQLIIMVQMYIHQLGRLTSALYKYNELYGFPKEWSGCLADFQIVVECKAGQLMLSPSGQFIVPVSCPAFDLVDFMSKNMKEASSRLELYAIMKKQEQAIHMQCMSKLGLSALEKDDDITPDLMVTCCQRILHSVDFLGMNLQGLRLRISHHYSLRPDGEMCIPWNWTTPSWQPR
ncbi:DUF4461 domain-containing protein [Caerostris extrusa]|uniref:DUF4461 domain-containing protein n=1 Tax=Caerostris extrusa TaxID=172846 RepID=A0AAV4QUK2_CAEEX|nr:DUF4461 domain-containing protein [Caerostris extrusa]